MQWKFDPVGGHWVALFLVLLLLATPWLVGNHGQQGQTAARRLTLIVLRVLASLLLLFAWYRPTLVTVSTEEIRSTLLMLVDSSRSMTVRDGLNSTSRWETAVDQIRVASEAIASIQTKNDLKIYQFDRSLKPLTITEGQVAFPQSPTGDESAIGASLVELMERESRSQLMGVILLSDGAQRALPPADVSPLVAARRLAGEQVPLYAFAIGDRASRNRADLMVEDLTASERAFVGAPLNVRALLRATGFANRNAKLRLLWESAEGEMTATDTKAITLQPGIDAYPIELTHTPTTAGEWKVTVEAIPLDGETLTDNNLISSFVKVREGGIQVLYLAAASRVGGAPSIEQRFVRASLASSPDIVVTRPEQPIDYLRRQRDLRKELTEEEYDVIVLDDVDADAFNLPTWNLIAEMVEQGTGLVMVGGRHSFGPGGHRATRMADLLPMTMGRAERQAFQQPLRKELHLAGQIKMMPSEPFGIAHPVMQLDDSGKSAWFELPPLEGANRFDRARLKPNAQVLAASDANDPLLVSGQAGLGRVLAFAGDTTWQWVLAGKGESHRRFWRQMILWLAKQEDSSGNPVRIELASRRVTPGANLEVIASVRLEEQDAAQLQYEAVVKSPDGSIKPLSLPNLAKDAVANFNETREPGDYTVEVRARVGEEELGMATARFTVPQQDLELDRPAADPSLLARLAEMTGEAGGRSLAPEELPTLLEELSDLEVKEKQQITSRYTPWDQWPFLLLFAGILSLEWGLRRRWGLP